MMSRSRINYKVTASTLFLSLLLWVLCLVSVEAWVFPVEGPPDKKMYWVPVNKHDFSKITPSGEYYIGKPGWRTQVGKFTADNGDAVAINMYDNWFKVAIGKKEIHYYNEFARSKGRMFQVLWFPPGAVTWVYIQDLPQNEVKHLIQLGTEGGKPTYACRVIIRPWHPQLKIGTWHGPGTACRIPYHIEIQSREEKFQVLALTELGAIWGIDVNNIPVIDDPQQIR